MKEPLRKIVVSLATIMLIVAGDIAVISVGIVYFDVSLSPWLVWLHGTLLLVSVLYKKWSLAIGFMLCILLQLIGAGTAGS